jgi:hypothetical protein
MTTQPPIACSLGAAEMPARRAEIAVLARALLSAEAEGTRAMLRFRAGARARERAAAFVEAEGRCCPFLRMELRDGEGALTLTIEGPAGSEPVVDELVGAFGPC